MTRFIIYLTIFLLPVYLIKVPLAEGASINILDVLLLSAIVLSIQQIRRIYSPKVLKYFLFQCRFYLFMLACFIFSFFVSYLHSLDRTNAFDGLGILVGYLLLPICFGVCVALLSINHYLKLQWLIASLFASIGAQAIIGYIFVVQGELTYDNRLVFIYGSPNFFAILLAIGVLLGIHLLSNPPITSPYQGPFSNKTLLKIVTFFILILLFANIFALYKTQSLGSWLGLILALTFYLLHRNYYHFSKIIPAIVFGGYVPFFIAFFSIGGLLSYSNYISHIPPTSFDSRIAIYKSAKNILHDNLVLGIGPGNFQKQYLEYQKFFPPYPQWAVPHAHNLLLHIWLEGGLFAFVFFNVFIAGLLFFTKKNTTPSEVAMLAILLYFMTHGLADMPLWKNDLSVIFWTFATISIIFRYPIPKDLS